VSGNKVADEEEDGHDDMLSNRDDIRTSDLASEEVSFESEEEN
jgi:hypothetical protein